MVLKYVGVIEAPPPTLRRIMYVLFLLSVILLTLRNTFSFSTVGLPYYGYVLHGDIPWFNFRATQYMSEHGWKAFFHWFDYASWYPLGRPVGSTTYPGLQITAVAIHRGLDAMGISMSLNDVCVMLPVMWGLAGAVGMGALAFEVSGSLAASAAAMIILTTVPASAISSLAGEFESKGLASALVILTFYLWVRSLRCPRSWPIGALAGLAYGCVAASWGGYVFPLNVIALHAMACAVADLAKQKSNASLLRAYALFYVVGTAIATRVPPVGMAPFKSLEQLSALMVLLLLFGLRVAEWLGAGCGSPVPPVSSVAAETHKETTKTKKATKKKEASASAPAAADVEPADSAEAPAHTPASRAGSLRLYIVGFTVLVFSCLVQGGLTAGLIEPPSPRLRAVLPAFLGGRTLADSAAARHHTRSPMTVLRDRQFNGSVQTLWEGILTPYFFWLTYMMVAMTQLASRAERPVSLFAPLLSALSLFLGMGVRAGMPVVVVGAALASGLACGWAYDTAVTAAFWDPDELPAEAAAVKNDRAAFETELEAVPKRQRTSWRYLYPRMQLDLRTMRAENPMVSLLAFSIPLIIIVLSCVFTSFRDGATEMTLAYIHPGVTYHVVENETLVRVEDYYDGYAWLRQETAAEARVMTWVPHGFQLAAIAERTGLIDSNAWHEEQLALVAKVFASPVEEAHTLVRHLADYILIWAGESGPKDIYHAPLMALTANALFKNVCFGDPLCHHFTFTDDTMTRPRPLLRQSLIYTLHQHNIDKRKPIMVNPELFEEVYTSPRGLVRIFKVLNVSESSKKWMADPEHRSCQAAPDEWICPGEYPPAEPLQALWKLAEGGFDQVDEHDLPMVYPNTEESEM